MPTDPVRRTERRWRSVPNFDAVLLIVCVRRHRKRPGYCDSGVALFTVPRETVVYKSINELSIAEAKSLCHLTCYPTVLNGFFPGNATR